MVNLRLSIFALCAVPLLVCAEDTEISVIEAPSAKEQTKHLDQSFTGRVIGNKVRMRVNADLESAVVAQLTKDDLVIIKGQKGDFYAVEPLSDQRAYIFRSFILDGVVEGNRVNVRLHPNVESPIISHLSSGYKIDGKICKDNHKWMEIDPPADTAFYVAKEYIENVGTPEVKITRDKRQATVNQLLDSANLLVGAELRKPFTAIDIQQLTSNYQTIVNDYSDFPEQATKARKSLAQLQEDYLNKKIAYLEAKAKGIEHPEEALAALDEARKEELHKRTDRMKSWESIEEALYLTWSGMHHAKTIDDYYAAQKENPVMLTGVVEAFSDAVKCAPGDFQLTSSGVPFAYVYSTHVNLQALVGKQVHLIAAERPNNHFAFPAYYVLEAE